jgi:hypothetical protein
MYTPILLLYIADGSKVLPAYTYVLGGCRERRAIIEQRVHARDNLSGWHASIHVPRLAARWQMVVSAAVRSVLGRRGCKCPKQKPELSVAGGFKLRATPEASIGHVANRSRGREWAQRMDRNGNKEGAKKQDAVEQRHRHVWALHVCRRCGDQQGWAPSVDETRSARRRCPVAVVSMVESEGGGGVIELEKVDPDQV